LIAVVRTTFSSSSKTIASANAASAKSEVVVPKASPPPAVVVDAPKAAEPAKPAEAAPAAEPAKPGVTGDAKEEKAKTKAALNKGKLADAIEAGEKATALDETDSEAWLLLGAAYQEKGDLANARNAYKSCLEKGTKDRFQRECRMFAR
jgi:Flp pilus assembly protein TadD